MGMDEYLEKLCVDAFKREWDADENVVRSLPFFAAALALTVTVLGIVAKDLPPLGPAVVPITAHIALLLAATSVGGVLHYLIVAVRPRIYRYPPPEGELIGSVLNWIDSK